MAVLSATQFIALDCEMVGGGYKGCHSLLARVSIVNSHGHVLYDTFVKPQEPVTDYRTFVSGVRARDLKNAPSFTSVQRQVAEMTDGKIIVGHALDNDLKALLLSHPYKMIRDTSHYPPFKTMAGV
jgi:RNA exonuclease 4